MNDIGEAWHAYRLQVVPLNAPEVQVVECRRAYYAGAGAIVRMLQTSEITAAPALVRDLDALRVEVERFRADVTAGRA
jgi:hypothetical protein